VRSRAIYAARAIAWLAIAIAIPVVGTSLASRLGGLSGGGLAVVGSTWLWFWLPRSAHATFDAGELAVARRRYRMLAAIAVSPARERSARLSIAGCAVAAGALDDADRLLAALDDRALDASERTVWLNNRACVTLARGADPAHALALIDEASALRPDVAAVQHTRGMALIAVGRVDEAIAVLDGMRTAGELPPRLDAERCRELARAWELKGETAYAADYRMRAAR